MREEILRFLKKKRKEQRVKSFIGRFPFLKEIIDCPYHEIDIETADLSRKIEGTPFIWDLSLIKIIREGIPFIGSIGSIEEDMFYPVSSTRYFLVSQEEKVYEVASSGIEGDYEGKTSHIWIGETVLDAIKRHQLVPIHIVEYLTNWQRSIKIYRLPQNIEEVIAQEVKKTPLKITSEMLFKMLYGGVGLCYHIGESFKLGPILWKITSAEIKLVSSNNDLSESYKALLTLRLDVKNAGKETVPLRIYNFAIYNEGGTGSYYQLTDTSEKLLKTKLVYPHEADSLELKYFSPEEYDEDISKYEIEVLSPFQPTHNEEPYDWIVIMLEPS